MACVCGRVQRGERAARHQVVPCPGCGRKVFVLPRSLFDAPAVAPPGARSPWRPWRAPLVAAGVCGAAVVAGFFAALPHLSRPAGGAIVAKDDPQRALGGIPAVRAALAGGKFHLAARLSDEALQARRRWPAQLTPAEGRELDQLWREAQLLARLSPRSLEEVVRHAMLVRDAEEWSGHWADYQGRSVIFDDVVRRDADGQPVLANHAVEVEGAKVRLALEDLAVLRDLPLDDGPRLVFGARLARCAREEGGVWVVRFEPESGVLLTDVGAVEACIPGPADEGLREALARQKAWLEGR